MFHHHRPVFASVCSTTLSAPFTLKAEVGGSTTSSSNWAAPPLKFGRTASPALESEDERSPPSSPQPPFDKDITDSVQREQLLHQQVGLLTNGIRYLSHKAQVQGLSGDERELLKAQLLALELYIARINAPHTQPFATTTAITGDRSSSPPASDLASGVAADRHWHHDIRDHHLGVNVTSLHKKRAKRTFNRACVHCGTQFTSQWRKGPAGASTLCNACGIRYARRLKKDAKAAAQASSTPKPHDDAGKRSSVYSLLN